MLTTIGAFLLVMNMTELVIEKSVMVNIGLNKPTYTEKDLKVDDPILQAVVDYYNHQGEWQGVFTIERIVDSRITTENDGTITAQVKYHYKAIPNNAQGRTDNGIDTRKFVLIKNGQRYTVLSMGGYQSGVID